MSVLNDRIAKAKGWEWLERAERRPRHSISGIVFPERMCHWRKPDGSLTSYRPDFTGTLEGLVRLMQGLGSDWGWGWWHSSWICFEKNHRTLDEGRKLRSFFSPDYEPGDCVGSAWLSVFDTENLTTSQECDRI